VEGRRGTWVALLTALAAAVVLRDRVSGSTFGFERGLGIDGPLGDRRQARLPALVAKTGGGPMRFPAFGAFWPDGTTWHFDTADLAD